MILVDANLLIYAYAPNSPFHAKASSWFAGILSGGAGVGIPWHSILAFIRLSTQRESARPPVTIPESWEVVSSWLKQPGVWTPSPTERHAQIFGSLLSQFPYPKVIADAHLAAMAIEHNLTLCTTDGGFARFPDLRWQNPLQH